ncbi:MAG TPA: type II toxin-antitoxin system HipA family toxin [Gammaproteobacteria bacterium]|nr:type II toxin-antitoxin system HipA family toxin [Gammaproteobacteria bacterium]
MNFNAVNLVHVYYEGGRDRLSVGRIALKDRQFYFEYDAGFLKTGLLLSPFKLPLKSGLIIPEDRVFQGLFGVFNDSLPDGWGRLLVDRKCLSQGINPQHLSPIDRLCFVGRHSMGALTYEPILTHEQQEVHYNFDVIAQEIVEFQEEDSDRCVDELLTLAGSSAGARPKVVIRMDGEEWIVKFRSSHDFKDSGAIEYAYHLMAKKAGLALPEAKLFPSQKCAGYFGVKRFDRVNNKPIHMHSLSGLLHVDHREPTMDYDTILKVTSALTKNTLECEKQFRAAVFNVFSHNRDDHTKNFSFLMSDEGVWSVSPAYDLIFSSGPRGEHCTLVMGEGRHPQSPHLLQLAFQAGIKAARAKEIIGEVRDAVNQWPVFAKEAGVSPQTIKLIHTTLYSVVGHHS